MLYVFVSIGINITHFVDCIRSNFTPPCRIGLVSTIQFVTSLQALRNALENTGLEIVLPQCKPLSPGEILGWHISTTR
ncbi:Diphthamide biosynthesis protein 1 [Parelaphostrongylus tenuis]|uniref:2-(3-amino-3-carboxypropyl)histidine synthase subunit 1 n=1 Tax=Parelaphostrongylus tenuis TaxID=148309 RepID=A0AAD5R839_PARTN|nr:Diphthamide biosynthesis protein 1 [Parelaphostrongylus tenuis]